MGSLSRGRLVERTRDWTSRWSHLWDIDASGFHGFTFSGLQVRSWELSL